MTKLDITPEQAANLDKLATYLEGLPEDYALFDMSYYETVKDCGTVACSCGHGPLAGIERRDDEIWDHYSDRVFSASPDNDNWDFMFSGNWCLYQPTHQQAAARIRVFLKDGIPQAFSGYNRYKIYTQSLEQSND